MTNWKRFISLLLAAVLLVNISASALADDGRIMTQTELEAAWALTGLDENAAQYREGMAFSEHMNARQLRCWLDELLNEEVAGIQSLYSELETSLYEIQQENSLLYQSMTQGSNAGNYQRLRDTYNEMENLRHRIRYLRDQLDIKISVIGSRMDILTKGGSSDSAMLTASRQIEEAAEDIRKIRAELAENAEDWVASIAALHASMTVSGAANDLRSGSDHAEWIDSILTYHTAEPVSAQVSASVLYPSSGLSLTARLLPVSSALADSSSKITVDVMDANSIVFKFVDAADKKTPLANVTVTLDAGGLPETLTSTERGNVTFSADKHNPNDKGEVTGKVDVKAEGYRGFLLEQTTFQKGETRTYALVKDDETVYVRGASFVNNSYARDILMDTYTAFHSDYNDEKFTLGITASRPCTVTLTYTDTEGKTKTLKKDTNRSGYINFDQEWKKIVKPGADSLITVSLTEGTKAGETRKLDLSFVKGVLDQPITEVTDFMSIFSGVGLSLSLPGDILEPLGGMTLDANLPFTDFMLQAVGNIDGTFLVYMGYVLSPETMKSMKTEWKSKDQKDLDANMEEVDSKSFKDTKEKTQNGISNYFNRAESKKHPFLGSAALSISGGGAFLGQYVDAGDGKNWQYSFKAILCVLASVNANFKTYFTPTPPIYLDIAIQASVMFSVQFAFQAAMKDGVTTNVDVDWGAWGFSLTIRLSITVGVSIGIPGFFTVTVGGYVWLQIFLAYSAGTFELKVTFGGGVFLEVKLWLFSYRWNLYDSGELVLKHILKKASTDTLPWYDSLLARAQAEENATQDDDGGVISLLPESYSALAPNAKLEMANFSLGDSEVKFETINGDPYMFYIDKDQRAVAYKNLRTGAVKFFHSHEGADVYSFDVTVQHPIDQFRKMNSFYSNKDIVFMAYTATSGYTRKEVTGAGGQKQTISVPNDTWLGYSACTFNENGDWDANFPGFNGSAGMNLDYFDAAPMDRPVGNVQVSMSQGVEYDVNPTVNLQVLLDDMVGDQNERDYVIIRYLTGSFKGSGWKQEGSRVIVNQALGSGNPYEQIMGADMTPGFQISENLNTLYTLQDGTLKRTDYYFSVQERQRDLVISDAGVSFFTVFDDTENPYHPHIFYLEDEEVKAPGEDVPSLIHHLKAARIYYGPGVRPENYYLDMADLDVTIPGGNFQVQLISDTIYLYWLETAPKDKASDPDVYRLRCVIYDPEIMVAGDDFVLAEFSAEPGTRPASLYLADDGTGYFVRWNANGTASVYSFPHKLVPHTDLRGITSSTDMVRIGTDVDFYLSVLNDGNTNLSTLDLEMVIQDAQGKVIKDPNGNEVRQRFHADFLHPENSSRTVIGDGGGTIQGAHAIYRTDDLPEPTQQSNFNVSMKTYRFLRLWTSKTEMTSSVKHVSSKHILPGALISLTLSVHIPTDLAAGNAANVVLRLAQNQANSLLDYGDDEIIVDRSEHDLDVGHRLYITPDGEERLAVTIYNHADNGEALRLYAELYLDNSPDPIYVDLPYYPELLSVGMTHSLDIPVDALLNGQQAQKVQMRILAAGAKEDMVRNNTFTFYVMNYTAPFRFLYQPVDTSVLPDGEAVFSVAVTGGLSPYEYQWQEYLGSDLGWKDIPGAEESALTLKGVKQSMNGRKYRCVAKDHNSDEITSDPAVLNVVSILPPTGDHTHLLLYISLAAAALLLAGALRCMRKKREQKQE